MGAHEREPSSVTPAGAVARAELVRGQSHGDAPATGHAADDGAEHV